MITLFLPWPNPKLSPNARVHWSVLAREKKKAKRDAYYAALEAGVKKIEADKVNVTVKFFPPDKRRRDSDNAIASMKAAIDGISLALGVDDSRFGLSFQWAGEIKMNGMVKVELSWEEKEEVA